jgi:hypothetical protein
MTVELWFGFQHVQEIFLIFRMSVPVSGFLMLFFWGWGVKLTICPFSAEVQDFVELYFYSYFIFMAWCLIKKHMDN